MREIDAVLRAGSRGSELHPYFVERYGSRGEAFTRSDGGYLATLAEYPQSHADEQVVWLAGLLARRGMPRWLMEEHLILLCEELSAAVPERAGDYCKLRHAAQELRQARLVWISQSDFDALVGTFAATCGDGLINSGSLLVSAVCDECCGLTEAVPTLTAWLSDAQRFSPQWRAAVAATLMHARNLATQSAGKPS
jgi:hypothetical protein